MRWLLRDISDCFCIELSVCDVTLDALPLGVLWVEDKDVVDDPERLATRCAVVAGSAGIFIGGKATGGSGFLGCAEDNVYV